MRNRNDHLTLDQILVLLHARATEPQDGPRAEQWQHLAECEECGKVADQYREIMAELEKFGKSRHSAVGVDCPPEEIWTEFVCGLLAPDEAGNILSHATACAACAAKLKEMLEVLGPNSPPPTELAQSLKSSQSNWQSDLASQIERRNKPIQLSSGRSLIWGRLVWMGAAAAAVLIAVLAYWLLRPASPEKLLAQAYAEQRTIELRLDRAPYGPVRVQRDRRQSQLNSSGPLLNAEVAIKKGLEKQPEDPAYLRQKAEVDLLNGDYQPAIETLGHALRLQPQSFAITLDLATAHFQRAAATGSPGDYEASLNYLSEALHLAPGNPAALFNRAITYERLYLFESAIADWEQFLKVENDPGWKKEGEQRLHDLRLRKREHGVREPPETFSVAGFRESLATHQPAAIEEDIAIAERHILPNISAPLADSQDYRAATTLAAELRSAHADKFLDDMLLHAAHPDFPRAARLLARSSEANHEGRVDDAYASAAQAAVLFEKSRNLAGELAAGFEQAYALQFQSKADSCQKLAGRIAPVASRQSYAALAVQLLLEQAICSNMDRKIGPAKALTHEALAMAEAHAYRSFYLRGLTVLATLESEAGDESSAWAAIHEGLGIYWKSSLPAVRAYSLYVAMERMAEQLDHRNVQFAAVFEALQLPNPSPMVEASERMRLVDAALRLGESQIAESQAQQAQQVFATAPQDESVRWRELEARISLARAQALRSSGPAQAASVLLRFQPEVERLSNRYVEFEYYDTLSDLSLQSRNTKDGEHDLRIAIQMAEDGLQSLSRPQERFAWLDRNRSAYMRMVELLFRAGDQQGALDVWEHLRVADAPLQWPNHAQSNVLPASFPIPSSAQESDVITYAFGHDGLMIWLRRSSEFHAVYVSAPPRQLRRAAENLLGECSRPDSDLSNLRADAQYLYRWMIEPVRQWLPERGHLIIEPDGILGVVPLEVLMDAGGDYLGTHYSITVSSSVRAGDSLNQSTPVQASDRALITAGLADSEGVLAPPPGAMREARHVAGLFLHPVVLNSREVKVARVGEELGHTEVFHFAGHAGLTRRGAAMLMADGILDVKQAQAFDPHKLSGVKLAVFSACGTAVPSEVEDSDSLVSAFLQAGAQHVVASRWNVDSVATAEFIDLFYGSVLSGSGVADAIRTAAATFRKSPERAHPYYWAAFAAFGRS